MPAFEECGVGWLEEPFPPQDRRAYAAAATLGRVPLAAGENHYTRYEFAPLLEDGDVGFVQPDLSKTGGITEAMRIAAMAERAEADGATRTPRRPRINMATSIHYLCAVDNPGYFEGDVTALQPVPRPRSPTGCRTRSTTTAACGRSTASASASKIDTAFIAEHPLIDGPCYV